ncbi:MAG TPA: sigma factor [Thermoleophilaceae bacterium]|nr:sigma factor [Thermoleophilaceae bacterium]
MTGVEDAILESAVRPGANGRRNRSAEPWTSAAIRRARQGDRSAIHLLYVRYADEVCGFVQRFVPDRREAEDITQAVFTKLTEEIEPGEGSEAQFVAWMLGVATGAALERLGR